MHRSGHIGINLILAAPLTLYFTQQGTGLLALIGLGTVALWGMIRPTGSLIRGLVSAVLFIGTVLLLSTIGLPGVVLFLMIVLASLPDIDMKLPITHRGPTHTILFAIGVGGLIGGSAYYIGVPEIQALILGSVGVYAIIGHFLGDIITPSGIAPFSPFSDRNFSLSLVLAKNRIANTGFLVLGAAANYFAYTAI